MASVPPAPPVAIGFREFVALIAALMALNALAVDSMLPALPQIGHALGVLRENDRQWVVTAYLLGFGVAQLFFGPLCDRFGRKPVLLTAISGYIAFSLVAACATTFAMLLVARVAQGAMSAASRVVPISMVRDRYAGRQMARVMSLTMIVFLAVPILAPSIGTLVLLVAPWRWIFGVLAASATAVLIWALVRLPETLHPEWRRPLNVAAIAGATRKVLTERNSLGYTLAQAVVMGGVYGFINSAQQIFFDIFHAPRLFPIVFAAAAGTMGIASLLNSRIVVRVGMRRVSHAALLAFIVVAALHTAVAVAGFDSLPVFAVLQALTMGCFGLAMGNFGAMGMEPLGDIAGTASSVQGFITVIAGSLLGFGIGQSFDGTTIPLCTGYLAAGVAALAIVLVTERGRLFAPHEQAVAPEPAPAAS